jgi:pyruvate formate lyase activating enzyme
LKCFFCQNCDISQVGAENFGHISYTSPDAIVRSLRVEGNNIGIAFTYNEPSINFEYITDVARKVRENDLRNVMVSNGYISPEPLKELLQLIDAFNIDLKAFSDTFYKKYTHSDLQHVKNTLIEIGKSSSHLEITFLVIPGLNDSEEEFKEMINWIASNFGKDLVLHISRYFPGYKSDIPPTPVSTLKKFHKLASEKLDFVYLGNISDSDAKNTLCPECKNLVIERGFRLHTSLNELGECENCGEEILNYY